MGYEQTDPTTREQPHCNHNRSHCIYNCSTIAGADVIGGLETCRQLAGNLGQPQNDIVSNQTNCGSTATDPTG